MQRANDMTVGKPLPLLMRFALPLMLSSVLQQLYSFCDSVIVGRLLGVEAFAAVGSASFLSWLPLSMMLGLTQGFGVLLAQRFGARDMKGLRRATAMSMLLSLMVGLALTTLALLTLRPLLSLMNTPSELVTDATNYLQVIFLGLSIMALYNATATVLRALGDSRSPFVALALATLVNIVLDVLFLAAFGMGVAGAALATVIAQLCSLAYCAFRIRRARVALPTSADFHPHRETITRLLSLGTPPMLRDAVIAVGGLFVQTIVNGYGVLFVAGISASRRYFSLMEMVGGALEGALATFVGQNTGAQKKDRIREGTSVAVRIAIVSSVVTALCAMALARPLISVFVESGADEVITIGVEAMRITALFLPALYLLYVFRAVLQGMGDTVTPMLSGFIEMALRIACVLILPLWAGHLGVHLADALGWVGALLLLFTVYRRRGRGVAQS